MTSADIEFLVSLCRQKAGLKINPDKTYFIDTRLSPVARREGLASIGELLSVVQAQKDDRLIWSIIEAMAAAETCFFRDRKPFEEFRETFLPHLMKTRRHHPIRVLSAACSTGQEAYSLAMAAASASVPVQEGDLEIIGVDLSQRALEKAQSGLYSQFEIQRGLPIRQLIRHFEKRDDAWVAAPQLRQQVRWRRVNLIADLRPLGPMDVIFCRNVLTLLEPAGRQRVLDNVAAILAPGGFLVLGKGETELDLGEQFLPLSREAGAFVRNPSAQVAA